MTKILPEQVHVKLNVIYKILYNYTRKPYIINIIISIIIISAIIKHNLAFIQFQH